MGDAFTLRQCSNHYLKAELTRLRKLDPTTISPSTLQVQRRYEEEVQLRGLRLIEKPDRTITFQQNEGEELQSSVLSEQRLG